MSHLLPVLHLMTIALRRRLAPFEAPAPDLIDHPALRRMTPRELADLPFPRPPAVQPAPDALGPGEPQSPEPHAVRPAA